MTDDVAVRVREIVRRIAEARHDRVLACSRAVSELEAALRPLNDPRLLSLIARLQVRLAERLAGEIEGGAG